MNSANPAAARHGRSRARRLLARAALALGSLVLGLCAAEIAVRAAGLSVPARGDAGAQNTRQDVPESVAPGIVFQLRPGQTSSETFPGAPGEEPRVVTYRVNELGFRGPPVAPEKPAEVFRIAALGDSFTYGTGVDEGDTWPAQLEARLRELAPERQIEVLNWGVPAYNTRQEIAQLNQRVKTYRPDLVLLCAYVNDASGTGAGQSAPDEVQQADVWETRWVRRLGLTSGRWEGDAPVNAAQRRMMALRERSRLADLAAYKLYGWLMGRVATRNYAADWTPGSPGLAMVKSALSSALVLSRHSDFELVAVMYPDLPSLGETYAFAEEHAAFASLCAELGIPFHDLTSVFDGRDPAALQAHAHDKHPNGAAHRLVAEALAALLLPRIERE